MASERLLVVADHVEIGHLDRSDGRLEFAYVPDFAARHDGEIVLSISLPARAEPYSEAELMPFFQGLLPEEMALFAICRQLQLAPADVFGLLRELGLDCAGAFSIVPEGYDLTAAAEEGVEWLSEEELAQKIEELPDRPLALEPERDIRISLAGAQNKMAVVVDADRVGLPRGTTPSTHILKPASRVPRSARRPSRGQPKLAFPGLVANEAFCMKVAALAGLRAADVRFYAVSGEPALLVKRYDREVTDAGTVRRLHQEDFGQALGVLPLRKYEKDGGPSSLDYAKLVRDYSASTLEDLPELVRRFAFNWAIGNADAHAKNFSLLHTPGGIRLSPGYDFASTYVYPSHSRNMATQVSTVYDMGQIAPVHWQKEILRLELDQDLYGGLLGQLADSLQDAVGGASEWIAERDLMDDRIKMVADLIGTRAAILKQV